MTTLIYGASETSLDGVRPAGGELWIKRPDLKRATGWELKPEGVCRGEQCIPIPPAESESFLGPDSFNLGRFAQHIGQPVVHDPDHDVWVFGEPSASSAPITAPDFTLPDMDGRDHSLSDFLGNKVFLATWASW